MRFLWAVTAAAVTLTLTGVGLMTWIASRPEPRVDVPAVNDIIAVTEEQWGSLDADDYASDAPDFTVVGLDGDVIFARGTQTTGLEAIRAHALATTLTVDGSVVGVVYVHDETLAQFAARESALLWAGIGTAVALCSAMIAWGLAVHRRVVRPFRTMTRYAEQVAAGDLDSPLPMDPALESAEFTEAFDLMREELARTRSAEQQARETTRGLVAQLSHDILTPIATIQATAEVLALDAGSPASERLEVIIDKARHVERLLGDLVDANEEHLQSLEVRPEELTSDQLETLVRRCDGGQLIGAIDIDECLVVADRYRLTQVFENVVGNAMKYGKPPVTVIGRIQDGFCAVGVHDDGPGVPPDELDTIAARGVRASNAGTQPGLGLGLYTSSVLMERLHGAIDWANSPRGFVVTISVPLAGVDAAR